MSAQARRRVILGIGIPLVAFVFLGLLVFAFSRILLAVPETWAPWIALLFATNILIGCALAATVRGSRGFTFLITVLVGTIAFGGIAGFVIGERPVHSLVEEEGGHGAADPGGQEPQEPSVAEEPSPAVTPTVEPGGSPGGEGGQEGAPVRIAAEGLQFSTSELTLQSGGQAVILFENREAVPHNVAVYTAPPPDGQSIFVGEVVTGPTEIEYGFAAPEPGSYYFQCDVHPTTMTGTLTVA